MPGGGEPPTPSGANGRLNRSPSKSRPPPAGPGRSGLTAVSLRVSPAMSEAPEPGRKGEVRRHGSSMESRPGEGVGTFREAGKGRRDEQLRAWLPGRGVGAG